MNRDAPYYADAVKRVKIGLFTEKYGLDITGIIHVGTNYGYEIKWYQRMGIPDDNIVGFEPYIAACEQFKSLYPRVRMYNYALGDNDRSGFLNIPAGDGQGASLLDLIKEDPNTIYLTKQEIVIRRFDSLDGPFNHMNCLVIDVQGYEMEVLRGFGNRLETIDMISVELSDKPLYYGELAACNVVDWLSLKGFMQVTPIEKHNDVFFLRRHLYRCFQ